MICAATGKACTPSLNMYNHHCCRCDGARKAMRDHKRAYRERTRTVTLCPICAAETNRKSGFCRECEAER